MTPLLTDTTRFLEGPNRHAAGSVLVTQVTLPPLPAQPMAGDDVASQMRAQLAHLGIRLEQAGRSGGTPPERVLAMAAAAMTGHTVREQPRARQIAGEGRELTLWLECDEPEVGHAAVALAVSAMAWLWTGDAAWSRATLRDQKTFRQLTQMLGLDMITRAMARAAEARDIPWYRTGAINPFVQIGQGARRQLLHETVGPGVSAMGVRMAHDKSAAAQLLGRLGLPVPRQALAFEAESAAKVATAIGYPVVVKPRHGSKSRNVFVDLDDADAVQHAFARAVAGDDSVVVEEMLQGRHYRLLVAGGRFIGAVCWHSPRVCGDGHSSVAQLVAVLNQDPRRGTHDGPGRLHRIKTDDALETRLRAQRLSLASVPAAGSVVILDAIGAVLRGGTSEDVTDQVHPDNRQMALDAAEALGLDIAGIDYIGADISQSWRKVGGGIHDINQNPGLRVHWAADNCRRDLVNPILDAMLRQAGPMRVPTVAVGLEPAAHPLVPAIARALESTGLCTGSCSEHGLWVGDQLLRAASASPGQDAQSLLMHPRVQALAFALPVDLLATQGMVLDRVDVAVLPPRATNPGSHEAWERLTRRSRQVVTAQATDPAEAVVARVLQALSLWPAAPKLAGGT